MRRRLSWAALLLLIELFDELVFGVWTAAWPLIRTDLGLSYVQIGLLLSVPPIFGNIIEPPLGLLGDAWDRRVLVRAGGVCFAAGLLLLATGHGFVPALLALMLLSPASGAFVSLSQAALMDLEPHRHEANMARWALAGSVGMVAGPLVLIATGALRIDWRWIFFALALFGIVLLVAVWRAPVGRRAGMDAAIGPALRETTMGALRALRRREVVRWLTLLQFADLVLDVLYAFLALYFVDVVGTSQGWAALAIVVWTGVGLAGDALAIPVLQRVEGTRLLRASAIAMLVVFPAFLLVPSPGAKLALLGVQGLLNSAWYAVLQGRLYSELPGRGATVMALTSLAGTVGALLPLGIGVAADRLGLGVSMWLLLAGPAALVLGLPRRDAIARPGGNAVAVADAG